MDSENKFWLFVVSLIVGGVCFISACMTIYYVHQDYVMTKHGYTQTTLHGHCGEEWVKIKDAPTDN